jgi:L-threonylcarbamoyladenylate synthase
VTPQIAAAAAALRRGELVILPTETVYGLGADASDPAAVARIFEAKGRPAFNPLIAHVADVEAARRIATLDERALTLAHAFWPGPLTLVLPATSGGVCDLARAGLDTVAVRMPAHALARQLLQAFDGAVAAPSANRSGRPSPTTLTDALEETGSSASAALDGGPCEIGLESTVLSVVPGEPPQLLRPGATLREDLEALIGPFDDADGASRRSPGRLTRHYAPSAPLRLDAKSGRPGEVFLAFGAPPQSDTSDSAADAVRVLNLSPAGSLREAAANLFSFLRAADAMRPVGIAVSPIPASGLGEAICDRLARAAGKIG